jgi:hypothetical protein
MSILTRQQRDELLARARQLLLKMYTPGQPALTDERLRALGAERTDIIRRYVEGLPRQVTGKCPHCGEIVEHTVDTFGMDGPWWDVFGPDLPPRACSHFIVLLCAIHFHGRQPVDAAPLTTDEICPGPEVPYVVSRLLNSPNTRCILYSTPIFEGRYTAYFMSYFTDSPQRESSHRHQAWLRRQFMYADDRGEPAWNVCNDVWDFDIAQWLGRSPRKVGWIDPSDPELAIQWTVNGCPYLQVDGRRQFLSIKQGEIHGYPPPDGIPFDADVFD